MTRTCADCAAPLPEHHRAQLCIRHADAALHVLTALPELVDDVNLTITRQTATGSRNGPRSSSDTVMAFNEPASKALAAVLARLVSWAKVALPALHLEQLHTRAALDIDDAAQAAALDSVELAAVLAVLAPGARAALERRHAWVTDQITYLTGPRWVINASHRRLVVILTDQFDQLLARDDGAQFARDLHRCHDQLLTASDIPAPRLYLGPCRADPLGKGVLCTAEVYAVDHSEQGKDHLCDQCRSVKCPVCSTVHDVAQRRAWLSEAINDRLATAGDITRGLATTTGFAVTKDQINWWVKKSRLLRHGTDPSGAALYRVGDVIDLAAEAAAAEAARHAKKKIESA